MHMLVARSPTTARERSSHIELNSGNKTRAVRFSANGEYLVSGDEKKVRVWRVEDGKQVATMAAGLVNCLAVSRDGRWIAAGTFSGEVIVWDTQRAYKKVLALENHYVVGLDFSPDSTQLLTASFNCTATIWDVANREQVLTLHHDDEILAAKYSPRGDRIAVATSKFIRVYDSGNGRVFVDINVEVTPWYNTGLLWSNDQLFIVSESKIKQIDAPTGEITSEWPVPESDASSCIALQQHGEFFAYSANRTVTLWDTSNAHTQLDLIRHDQIIRSISISPDDRFLAIAGERGKIIVRRLPHNMTDSTPLSRLHPTFQEPDIQIPSAILDAWKQDQLANADALLTVAIPVSRKPGHHVLAGRALVRARLGQWDKAIADAKESIKVQPSAIGYIAKSIALVGKGEKYKAYRECDIAFERFHLNHVSFLLLIKAIIVFMAGEHEDAISRLDDLIATVRFNSICYMVQAQMCFLLGNSYMESSNYEDAIKTFERARAKMRRHTSRPLSAVSLISGWKFDDLDITIRQRLCEALYAAGRTKDAGESLLKLVNTIDEEVRMSGFISGWIHDFRQRCLCTPESGSDITLDTNLDGNILLFHDTLDLPNRPTPLLREWAKAELSRNSWKDALVVSSNFMAPRSTIYRAVCEHLEAVDHIADATECLHQMLSEQAVETDMHDEQAQWVLAFKLRCAERLEHLGDTAMTIQNYDEAISRYSTALSLDLAVPQGLFVKRSKAYVSGGSWEDALNDANKVIALDPSSPWGYERKHAALHKAGSYDSAIETFKKMRSIMLQSPDPEIRERRHQYVDPAQTKAEICRVIQDVIHPLPHVLINTKSGSLCDKSKQASWFESLLVFKELISSMTMNIDYARIEQEVMEHYRYATLSHTWEDNEPLLEKVVHIVVYDLEESTTHDKLQMFCKTVRDAGFYWAWSDTCCINKADHVVLQEALVSMFKWYEGSAVTIVLLRGVRSPSMRGDLMRSIWNTRAWTFQEYHASKVVRFYNEDWTPYLNLDIYNHKESPEIISEMEEATSVSAQTLMRLQPGLNDIREKLRLASRRKTTRVEDTAYSLFGIFSVSLHVVYGEGDQALGRLLRELLACSGDTSILAWTGKSGRFNSCLPAKITVFEQFPPSHVPPAIDCAEMEAITARIRNSSLSSTLAMRLYDRLQELPVPSFSEKRMRLPCLAFKLGPVSAIWSTSGRVFRARADALGIVEITTAEDLSHLDSLMLVHPWIDFLLDRRFIGLTDVIPEENEQPRSPSLIDNLLLSSCASINSTSAPTVQRRKSSYLISRIRRSFSSHSQDETLLLSPSSVDKRTLALQLIARLRQPFGALLFKPVRQYVAEYKRVAAESMITVRIQEDTPLEMLMDSVRILDVL